MKYSIASLLAFVVSAAFATPPDSLSTWTPKGWKRVALATGDLNADGIDDAAIVLDKLNPSPKAGTPPPRRMLVVLGTPNGHKKILSRDDLLPSAYQADAPCWIDPMLEPKALEIGASTLTLAFHHSTSCGSYDISNEKFVFQLKGDRLQLSAYELSQFSRSSGDVDEFKVDYLHGTLRRSYGENLFDESQKATVKWEVLGSLQPMYLDEMSLSCDPEKLAESKDWCE